MRYRLRPRAKHNLEAIWDYSAATWGIDRAESYIRQIQTTCELLAGDAHLGRACEEIRPGYRKIRSGSHILFYREAEGDIEIVRILHQEHVRGGNPGIHAGEEPRSLAKLKFI